MSAQQYQLTDEQRERLIEAAYKEPQKWVAVPAWLTPACVAVNLIACAFGAWLANSAGLYGTEMVFGIVTGVASIYPSLKLWWYVMTDALDAELETYQHWYEDIYVFSEYPTDKGVSFRAARIRELLLLANNLNEVTVHELIYNSGARRHETYEEFMDFVNDYRIRNDRVRHEWLEMYKHEYNAHTVHNQIEYKPKIVLQL